MRGLIGDLCIKTYLVNQNPAETCQVFGKNFSGQLYVVARRGSWSSRRSNPLRFKRLLRQKPKTPRSDMFIL